MSQETKKITLDAGVGVKIDPRFQKVMRDVQRGLQMGFNTKHIKEYSKEFDKVLKNSKAMGISVGKLGKVMKESYNKSLIDGAKAMKMLQAELQRTERMMERSTAAKARYARAMRYKMTRGNEGPMTAGMAAEYGSATEGFNARYDSTAAAKAEMIRDQMMLAYERQQQEKQDRRNLIASRTMQGAQIIGAGAQAANSIFQTISGYEGRKLGWRAEAAGLGGSLYNKLASGGGFSEVAAMLANGQAIQSIAGKAATASNVNAATQIVTGATQAIGSGALLVANPTAAMIGNSVGGIGGGVAQGAEGASFLFGGGDKAAYANAALSSIERSKMLDPVFQRAIGDLEQNAQSRLKQFRLYGGRDTYMRNAQAGADSVYGDQFASAALHNSIADRYGNSYAATLTPMAMRAEQYFGVNAHAAGDVLGAFGQGSSFGNFHSGAGASSQSAEVLEKIIGKGFARGIKDTQLKEGILEAVAGTTYGGNGRREASAGFADLLMSSMQRNDMAGLMGAKQGVDYLNNVMSSGQGLYGSYAFNLAGNVLRKWSKKVDWTAPDPSGIPGRMIYHPSQGGPAWQPSGYQQQVLATTTLEDLFSKSEFLQGVFDDIGPSALGSIVKDYQGGFLDTILRNNPGMERAVNALMKAQGISRQEAYRIVATNPQYRSLRGQSARGLMSTFGGNGVAASHAVIDALMVNSGAYEGVTGDALKESVQAAYREAGDPAVTPEGQVAGAQLSNLNTALSELSKPENAARIAQVAEATKNFIGAVTGGDVTNPAEVLGRCAASMEKIAVYAERIAAAGGNPYSGPSGSQGTGKVTPK